MLVGCFSVDEAVRPTQLSFGTYEVDPDGSVEDLFFEALRLRSAGLLGQQRMEELQASLTVVDDVYARDADYDVLLRNALLSHLRLASSEVPREDILALEGHAGRAYARRLHRVGVKASGQYAEGMILIAGMAGIPTSQQEALLMVAIPAGGYLLVKIGGMALKRAAFLLRHCKSADDVVRSADGLGFRVQKVADTPSLRAAVAREDTALAEHFEQWATHIPRTQAGDPPGPSAAPLSSMRDVDVRSRAPPSSEIRSIARGAEAYASADVLRSRLKTFIADQIKPEFDEPFEFFLHGTTHARAVKFEPEEGRRIFTATDVHVARLFAQRTVGREGGRLGVAVIALPRDIADQLRKKGVLRTQPVPDMPAMLETIFEPGAVEALENHAEIQPLPEGFFAP
ncbi:MAG: hypothetical protein JXB05_03170 [Myxococcaceae bacterium]|nr:hypothetical protein [Myxococcaceae bacterium]